MTILGEAAAERLIERFGGVRIYVPVSPAPGDALVEEIGLDAARRLAREFGGERVDLPGDLMRGERRAEVVRELYASGHRISDIARRARCSERWVYRILADCGERG